MKLFQKVVPLTAAGLAFDRPREQRLWSVLTNVVLNDGFIESRPGLKPVGPVSQDVTSRMPGVITAIGEAKQWVNEDSSIGSCQALVPNNTTNITGWTAVGAATIHAATDDSFPDNGTTYAQGLSDGDIYTASFANLSPQYDFVDSVTLHIRARATAVVKQALEIEHGQGSLGVLGTFDLSNTAYTGDTSGSGFMDFFLDIPSDFQSFPWTSTEVDAATFKIRLNKEALPGLTFLLPSTTGSDDGFSPAGDEWKAADGLDAPLAFLADRASVSVGEPGDRISIVFQNLTTLTTVTTVRVRFCVARQGTGFGRLTFYQIGNDAVRRNIATSQAVTLTAPAAGFGSILHGCSVEWSPDVGFDIVEVELATNPETGVAWTVADLQSNPEFGILVETGSSNIVFTGAELIVEGDIATTGAQLDAVELYVCGRTLGGASAGETAQQFLGRIMATTRSFYRLESQGTNQGADLVDILGATTDPTAAPYNWDMTNFFDRLYFENSVDTTYYYGGATISQLTAPPLGHTIWTFGNRLMKGDTISAGTRTIKRIAHTALAAPDTWTGAGSGTIDLTHGGEGRIRKGLSLSSHVAAVYLDRGIYNLRWTGDDASPFVPRFQVTDVGVIAPNSCVAALDASGISSHIFLGRGPRGVDVFLYDGTDAHPVGGEIIDELKRLANHATLEYAFAALDPETNSYLLFVAEDSNVFPRMAWVYSLPTGQWMRWDLPFAVSAAGYWTLVDLFSAASPEATPDIGKRTLVLGTALGIPYQLDYDVSADRLNPAGSNANVLGYLDSAHESETRLAPVDYVIETGAVVFEDPNGPKDVAQLSAVHRVWITYEDRGQCTIQVELSNDGGKSFDADNTVTQVLGTDGPSITPSEELRETIVSFPAPKEGRHHSIRISSAATEEEARQKIKISRLVLEYEMLGQLP